MTVFFCYTRLVSRLEPEVLRIIHILLYFHSINCWILYFPWCNSMTWRKPGKKHTQSDNLTKQTPMLEEKWKVKWSSWPSYFPWLIIGNISLFFFVCPPNKVDYTACWCQMSKSLGHMNIMNIEISALNNFPIFNKVHLI